MEAHTQHERNNVRYRQGSFVDTAENAPPGVRISVEVRVTVADPFDELPLCARETDADGFYLETTGGQSGWGYFGVDPVKRLQVTDVAVPRTGGESVYRDTRCASR